MLSKKRYLNNCLLIFSLLLTVAIPVKAQDSPRPYVLLVNGWLNGCCSSMSEVYAYLDSINAEYHTIPWNLMQTSDGVWAQREEQGPSNDSRFLQQGQSLLSTVPPERPLVLIGHSFGGDSLLKLVPRISRQVELLVVIDPVAQGGLRRTSAYEPIPVSVSRFVNRWQQVAPFPDNFREAGEIRVANVSSTYADQDCQNIKRHGDGSPYTRKASIIEDPLGHAKGSPDEYQQRTRHQDLASDEYVQQTIIGYLKQVQSSRPKNPASIVNRNLGPSYQSTTVTGGNFRDSRLVFGGGPNEFWEVTPSGQLRHNILSGSSYQSTTVTGGNFRDSRLVFGGGPNEFWEVTPSGQLRHNILSGSSYQSTTVTGGNFSDSRLVFGGGPNEFWEVTPSGQLRHNWVFGNEYKSMTITSGNFRDSRLVFGGESNEFWELTSSGELRHNQLK